MTDLNSLSKEELIKLVTQKEEQLRAAEDLAEKRERSNIKFARGVTSLALLLKDVNGSYLAQVEEYLSYADDEEAKKAMKVLYDMISYGIKNYWCHFCANCKFLRSWKRSHESRRNF